MLYAWRFYFSLMLTVSLLFFTVLAQPHSFSMIDFWEKKCSAGDASACERLQQTQGGVEKLSRLDKRAEEYGRRIKKGEMIREDGKPALDQAYMVVMKAFIKAENAIGNNDITYDEITVEYCAGNFHEYWTNKKLWWPTVEGGDPDWTGIYFYIVDHYYGICLRRYYN